MSSEIRLENLSIKTRDGTVLVRDVSFAFGSGNPICLIGETGSGKSLVMHAVMGSLPDELICEGAILLDGENLLALSAAARRALWGRKFSLLPQEPSRSLDPTMTIRSQVAEIYPALHRASWNDAKTRAMKDLQSVGLDHAARSFPFELSGGMAQRASIAMAHAAGSMVLLADEPTKGLDRALCDVVAGMINHEVSLGRAVMVITHDLELAMQTTGMIGVMRNGVLVELGKADSVLHAPVDAYTKSLVAALPSQWEASSQNTHEPGKPVIAARSLGKSFGERALFKELDLTLRSGEITVALGPSGCGKSTLGNILLGLIKADFGTVERPGNLPAFKYQKIYQDPPAAFIPHQTLGDAFGDLRKRHGIDGASINRIFDDLGLEPGLLARRPDAISGGELQRFAIARALLLKPAMLFADEATSRLDPVSQKRVIDLLVAQVRERNLALMLVTHDHVLANKIADHVIDLSSLSSNGEQRTAA
ncbi:ABC transporter ATP-binding protein [Thalassospira sp. HJ]|uniref:ABC transporter ATP-binding protein n=1 Tax=Thalassospira sp. HJ TaxID=1616823 RepID=UPI0005CE4CAC|nr:ATP-binding cassette domain-containing protein [Thalassospira sp. HJ]KJE34347.1 ABC transporter ATP-binding protein [Thalassospira sp. HJ]